MKNTKPKVIKNQLMKICLGVLVFALVGCGRSVTPSPTTSAPTDSEVKSTISGPTDDEVKSICYKSVITITEILSGQKIDVQPGQTISEDQAKAMIEVIGIEKGTPRVSGANEINLGISDGTGLFPTRVTISLKSSVAGLPDAKKVLDFYFYKNDFNEWILAPENE